jgi:hypothetical protein
MKNERGRWLGLWLVTVLVAAWLGSRAGAADEPAATEARRGDGAGPPAREDGGGAGARGLGAEEVRALLRDELARAAAPGQPATSSTPAPGAPGEGDERDEGAMADEADGVAAGPPPPSLEEREQRVSDALAVVQGAVASGQWRAEERQRFAAATARLPAAELFEVTRQLNIAINRGQISLTDGLPPYGPAALLR